MNSLFKKAQKQIFLFLMDSVCFYISLYIALSFRYFSFFSLEDFLYYSNNYFFIYIIFILSLYIADLYNLFDILKISEKLYRILYVCLSVLLSSVLYFYLFSDSITPKTVLVIDFVFLFILLSLFRIYFYHFGAASKVKTLLISDNKEGLELLNVINSSNSNLPINISLNISPFYFENKDKLDIKNTISNYIKFHNINVIVLDIGDKNLQVLLDIIFFEKDFNNINILDIYDLHGYVFKKISFENINYKLILKSKMFSRDLLYVFLKRVMDICMSFVVLLVLIFIHPFVYFNLKREIKRGEGENSIFITRNRIGLNGKPIKILKYRTMLYSDNGEKWIRDNNTNRVTDFGSFLRKLRIDELPQVFAVIKGDISFVGPRQDEIGLYNKIKEEIKNYDFRYLVKPGLSGWAQTMMNFQPQSIEDTKQRFCYDMYYIKNKSIFLDVLIILKTIKTILSREG